MSLLSKSQSGDTGSQHPGPLHLLLSPAYEALCLLICLDNYFQTSSTRSWAKDLR